MCTHVSTCVMKTYLLRSTCTKIAIGRIIDPPTFRTYRYCQYMGIICSNSHGLWDTFTHASIYASRQGTQSFQGVFLKYRWM